LHFLDETRAVRRASFSATLAGVGAGLGLGALFLAAGMAERASDHARAERAAAAALAGYEGQPFSPALARYVLPVGLDARLAEARFSSDRGAAKARRRADLDCLTSAVYFEARGESASGQAAVAQVVLNRVKHPAYPKSVCGVVFQGAGAPGCQFSFACDGSMSKSRERLAWARARDVAMRALSGVPHAEIGSATHFHTTAVSPAWAPRMLRVAHVGAHVFYRYGAGRSAPTTLSDRAVLIGAPAGETPNIAIAPSVQKAIESSLEPVSPPAAAPQAAQEAHLTKSVETLATS
jgi:spore germination cell wall hydrolase CwlJ-like protein